MVEQIMAGFGCTLLAYDPYPHPECAALGVRYVPLLLAASDIVTLHCPLTPETHRLIDAYALSLVKTGGMLINTSRGAVLDTCAVIDALTSGQIGYPGPDVYKEEEHLFSEDLSAQVLHDVFARLITFANVLITAHQAFFTHEALTGITETTPANVSAFERGEQLANAVTLEQVRRSAPESGVWVTGQAGIQPFMVLTS